MNCNTIKWMLSIIVALLSPIIITLFIATIHHLCGICWLANDAQTNLYNMLYLWLNVFIAVGTIAVAILAVYGDKIKSCLFRPELKLEIIPCEELSEYDYDVNKETFYYHLRVRNEGDSDAKKCRVLLKEIREHDGTEIKFSVPPQFTWAPAEIRPKDPSLATIFRKQSESLAFCRVYKTVENNPQYNNELTATDSDCQVHVHDVKEDSNGCTKIEFSAVLCKTSSEKRGLQIVLQSYQHFQGWIDAFPVRLGMEIVYANQEADSKKLQFFEINWDGHWSDKPDCLFNNLHIKDVTDEVKQEREIKQKNEELKRRKDMYE